MRVALEHLHAPMTADARHLHGMETFLKKTRDCLVAKVVPSQIIDLELRQGTRPNEQYGVWRGLENVVAIGPSLCPQPTGRAQRRQNAMSTP